MLRLLCLYLGEQFDASLHFNTGRYVCNEHEVIKTDCKRFANMSKHRYDIDPPGPADHFSRGTTVEGVLAQLEAASPWIANLTPLQKSLFYSSVVINADSSMPAAYIGHEADAEQCRRVLESYTEHERSATPDHHPEDRHLHHKLLCALERCLQ